MRTSRKTELPETKNNFSVYKISQPTPSVSLSVPSCSLAPCDGNNILLPLSFLLFFSLRVQEGLNSHELTQWKQSLSMSMKLLLLFYQIRYSRENNHHGFGF